LRKILIAVTFRPFNGDDYNSTIQELFVKSIANQTYQNYEVIVTTFGEKDPSNILRKYTDKFTVYDSSSKSYFFKTIDNATKHAERGKNIMLWSNADSIFDDNFFDEIIGNFVEGQAGTSYPNYHYYNLDDFSAKKYNNNYDFYGQRARPELSKRKYLKSFFWYDPNIYISEAQYIDADLLMAKKNNSIYSELFNIEHVPGVSIFISLSALAKSHVNLIYKSRIHVLENSRIFGSQSKLKKDDFLEVQASNDESKTERFSLYDGAFDEILKWAKHNNVPDFYLYGGKYSSRKYSAHSSFIPVGNYHQKLHYAIYLLYWWLFPRNKFKLFSYFSRLLRSH